MTRIVQFEIYEMEPVIPPGYNVYPTPKKFKMVLALDDQGHFFVAPLNEGPLQFSPK